MCEDEAVDDLVDELNDEVSALVVQLGKLQRSMLDLNSRQVHVKLIISVRPHQLLREQVEP
jgi:hypothetical protein